MGGQPWYQHKFVRLLHIAGPVYVEVGHLAGQGQGQEEVQEQEGAGHTPAVTGLAPPGRPP